MENNSILVTKEDMRSKYACMHKFPDLRRKGKISVAMPITGDDGRFCFYSLPILNSCPIDELILYLDRPSKITKVIVNAYRPANIDTKIILNPKRGSWKHSIAEAFFNAFNVCSGDYIFSMAADIITDPLIYNRALFEDVDLISFRYSNLTMGAWPGLSDHLSNFWNYLPWVYSCDIGKFSGHFAMKKSVWETIKFKDVASPDLQFFNDCARIAISHRYYKGYAVTHFRSGNADFKQIRQACYRLHRESFFKTVGHGLLNLKIRLLAEYLKLKVA